MTIMMNKTDAGLVWSRAVTDDDMKTALHLISDEEEEALREYFTKKSRETSRYIKIEFTLGLKGEAYQVIQNERCVAIVDLDGKEIVMPEVTESRVIDDNPKRPKWA